MCEIFLFLERMNDCESVFIPSPFAWCDSYKRERRRNFSSSNPSWLRLRLGFKGKVSYLPLIPKCFFLLFLVLFGSFEIRLIYLRKWYERKQREVGKMYLFALIITFPLEANVFEVRRGEQLCSNPRKKKRGRKKRRASNYLPRSSGKIFFPSLPPPFWLNLGSGWMVGWMHRFRFRFAIEERRKERGRRRDKRSSSSFLSLLQIASFFAPPHSQTLIMANVVGNIFLSKRKKEERGRDYTRCRRQRYNLILRQKKEEEEEEKWGGMPAPLRRLVPYRAAQKGSSFCMVGGRTQLENQTNI